MQLGCEREMEILTTETFTVSLAAESKSIRHWTQQGLLGQCTGPAQAGDQLFQPNWFIRVVWGCWASLTPQQSLAVLCSGSGFHCSSELSLLHTSVVLAHVYLVGIKMCLNFRNENGNLNRKHGRLTCSSLSLLHLLDICFKNQNIAVSKALGVEARRETHPCPTQGVYSWGWFIYGWNYTANHRWCWKVLRHYSEISWLKSQLLLKDCVSLLYRENTMEKIMPPRKK